MKKTKCHLNGSVLDDDLKKSSDPTKGEVTYIRPEPIERNKFKWMDYTYAPMFVNTTIDIRGNTSEKCAPLTEESCLIAAIKLGLKHGHRFLRQPVIANSIPRISTVCGVF